MGSYRFPLDVGTEQVGHYIGISAFKPVTIRDFATAASQGFDDLTSGLFGTGTTNNRLNTQTNVQPSAPLDTFVLFVPGGSQNSLEWQTEHEYSEVKLARVLGGSIAAVTGGGQGIAGGILPGLLGAPINPRVEVLFRNTQLRKFQFTFLMAPSNEAESIEMEKIIKGLRFHAAPEINANVWNSVFIPPSEFVISFFYKEPQGGYQENTHLPKLAKGVIERIDVNYTPQGEWSTFRNGYPVTAQLTFVFRELRIIDKNQIRDGY